MKSLAWRRSPAKQVLGATLRPDCAPLHCGVVDGSKTPSAAGIVAETTWRPHRSCRVACPASGCWLSAKRATRSARLPQTTHSSSIFWVRGRASVERGQARAGPVHGLNTQTCVPMQPIPRRRSARRSAGVPARMMRACTCRGRARERRAGTGRARMAGPCRRSASAASSASSTLPISTSIRSGT